MSYVDEVYERVTAQNPNEPEFQGSIGFIEVSD